MNFQPVPHDFTILNSDPLLGQLLLVLAASGICAVLVGVLLYTLSDRHKIDSKAQVRPSKSSPLPTKADSVEKPWTERLFEGLSKTRTQISSQLRGFFETPQTLDQHALEKVHEVLYKADIGVATCDKLVASLSSRFANQSEPLDWETIRGALREEIRELLLGREGQLTQPLDAPLVILVVGVNGVGKTTTIGKLAMRFKEEGKQVLLCAADTYRAAAADQLEVWGERVGVDVIRQQAGSDPAAVAYDGVKAAIARKADVLLVDTAGRLHNKSELMDELQKIRRVIGKDLPGAPHESWIVVDATTGQNALAQVDSFKKIVDLTGIIVTKLDGTAKGGVVIGAVDQSDLRIPFIGVGEKAADLQAFSPEAFADSLL